MKNTKLLGLTTIPLLALMMFAMTLNVMAAQSNAVKENGLTVQMFTDKDSYKVGESIKVSLQVDNQTGSEVSISTEVNVPANATLASQSATFNATLQSGKNWSTPEEVLLYVNSAKGNSPVTGDYTHVGIWIILLAAALGCIIALFVYGKKKSIWLSILLCVVMVSCLINFAIPVQAADTTGSIDLSCTIQIEGMNADVSATINYIIHDGEEDSTAPSEESSEPTEGSSEPTEHVHTVVEDKAVAPTCTETGLTAGKHCSVCNEIIQKQEVVPAKGHSYTNYVSNNDATCTEDGTKTAICDRDSCDVKDTVADTGSKREHKFTNYVSNNDATCEADGTKTAECDYDDCDEEDTVADTGSKLPHSGEWSVKTAPTYDTTGTLARTCEGCGEDETFTLPKISEDNGYVQIFDGLVSCWQYTHEGVDHIFNVADDATDSYSFGVEAWYMHGNGNDTPSGASGFKYTDALWNSATESYSGSGKTYTTTIMVGKDTTVTLLLKCAEDTSVPFFGAEGVLNSIQVNGSAVGVSQNTVSAISGGSAYNTYVVANLPLKAGANTITFETAAGANFQGIGFQSTEPITLADDKVDLNLMSFNINSSATGNNSWNNRKVALIQSIIDRNPDVVCFQEVKTQTYDDLVAGLPDYEIFWYIKVANGEGLAIAYKKDVMELVARDRFWLSDTPSTSQTKYTESEGYRICMHMELKHKATGQHLHVFNVHLDGNETARNKQIQVMLNEISTRYNTTVCPTYITGDFNTTSAGLAYTKMAEKYRDCQVYAPVTDSGATYQNWGSVADNGDTPRAFSFVCGEHFVTNKFEICRDKCGTNNANYLSDHYAIMTNVSLLFSHEEHIGDWSVEKAPTYDETGTLTRTCSYCHAEETFTLPKISEGNGYVQKITGVLSRWEYMHEDNTFIFDVVENNAQTNLYSFGVEAWYMNRNGSDTPGFKYTNANWNSTSYSGSGKTYTTTIVVEKATTVTLLLKCAEDTSVPFFGAEGVLGDILLNGRTDGVILDTTSVTTGDGEYHDYAVATLFLETGTNTVTFNTANDTNFQGIGFQSTEPIILAKDKVDLKLMSFNIRQSGVAADAGVKSWAQRKAAVIANLLELAPDVVCFQEITDTQADDLAAGLTGYTIAWYSRDNGSEGLAVAYKTGIWNEIEKSRFWLSNTPDTRSKYSESNYYRIGVNVLLQHKASGQYLNVFCVHLDNNGRNNSATANVLRGKQMQVVLDRAALTDYPTYIAGDFNCRSDDQAYKFTAEQYRDCQVFAPDTDSGATYQGWGTTKDNGDTPIDFCFVSDKHFVTHTFEIRRDKWGTNNTNYLSDHYAVMTNASLLVDHVEVVDEAVDPTCTENGLTEGKHCGICGEVFTAQQVVLPLNHDIVVDEAKAPSCTETGLTVGSHCTRCDDMTVAQTVIEKLPHTYDNDADNECNVCGFDRSVDCEHENTEPVGETKDATCTVPGSVAGLKCADCETVLVEPETIPALNHKFDVPHCVDPTFDAAGEIGNKCSNPNCDEKDVVTLPALNTTDYTTETKLPEGAANALVTPVQATTTFTYNGAVEYTTSVEVSDILSVDLGDGRGSMYYSRYEVAKLCNENVTVTYDEATGYTCHAETAQTLTHISVYGNDLTLTGTWNINPSKRIEIHDGNLYIGTNANPAYVTITATRNSFTQAVLMCFRTGEDLTIAKDSTLKLQSQGTGTYPSRLISANYNVSNDYSKIDIYGTLIAEQGDGDYDIFMQQYHQLTVHEGGELQCGELYMGKNNKVSVSGTMTVKNYYSQKQNSVLTISETGSVEVKNNLTAENSTLKVNGGKLKVGGKVDKCSTFTVTGSTAVVEITGTSAKTPTVSDGASVTINGVTC